MGPANYQGRVCCTAQRQAEEISRIEIQIRERGAATLLVTLFLGIRSRWISGVSSIKEDHTSMFPLHTLTWRISASWQ